MNCYCFKGGQSAKAKLEGGVRSEYNSQRADVRAGVGAAKAISGDNKVRTLDNHYIFENAVKVAALDD